LIASRVSFIIPFYPVIPASLYFHHPPIPSCHSREGGNPSSLRTLNFFLRLPAVSMMFLRRFQTLSAVAIPSKSHTPKNIIFPDP